MLRPLHAVWLGTQPYASVYRLQCALLELRRAGAIEDTVLLLEHEPTITLGRGAQLANLLTSTEALENRGIALQRTDRGGDVTLHAPGQLVAYPIVNLAPERKDVRRYVNALVQTMGDLVTPFGISAGQVPELVGLWVDLAAPDRFPHGEAPKAPAKLGAIGVRISRWVTMHGFALNLTTDLELFRLIVPCGIREFSVASVQSVSGASPSPLATSRTAHDALCARLGRTRGGFFDLGSNPAPEGALARALAGASLQ